MKSCIFFIFLIVAVSVKSIELKGIARTLNEKKIVYFEEHEIELDEKGFNKRIRTKYLSPDGKVFAKMESNFSTNILLPDIDFEDLRFQRKESILLESGKIKFKQKIGAESEVTKEFQISSDSPAGQGFDNFIKLNFDVLQSKPIPLRFGVLSEMSFYSFKAYKKELLNDQQGNNLVRFGIVLTNPFYRIFASELMVTYDVKTKQLKSYQGLSNILDEHGKKQSVQIDYELVKN